MSDLKVDAAELSRSSSQFYRIQIQLDIAERVTELGERAGHDGLDSALREFANEWDIEREHLSDKCGKLGLALSEAAGAYTDLESKLVTAITDR